MRLVYNIYYNNNTWHDKTCMRARNNTENHNYNKKNLQQQKGKILFFKVAPREETVLNQLFYIYTEEVSKKQ